MDWQSIDIRPRAKTLMTRNRPAANSIFRAALGVLMLACPAAAAENRYFDSDGVRLRYVVEGEGAPLLLIHGLGASIHLQWGGPGVLDDLAKQYRVIAYDNRGHGRSGKPHDAEKYGDDMVADAVRMLDHLEIAQAHIVGYSMGAMITSKLLAEHPERFLTATLGGAGWVKANDERAVFLKDLADSLDREEGIGPLLARLTPDGRPQPNANHLRFRLVSKAFGLVNDQKALAAVARALNELAVSEEQLRSNRVPTLALIGDKDPLKVTVDEMAEVMPHLTVSVIPDADHFRAYGRPEFIRELKSFLATHSAKVVGSE
jgi:pimeloyl-ACP methyl ester carboxylesterase